MLVMASTTKQFMILYTVVQEGALVFISNLSRVLSLVHESSKFYLWVRNHKIKFA